MSDENKKVGVEVNNNNTASNEAQTAKLKPDFKEILDFFAKMDEVVGKDREEE